VQQTAAKDRERRILQLTIDEINQMEGDVNLYKGVGKMCVGMVILGRSCRSHSYQVYDGAAENHGGSAEGTREGTL
jgi:hypothetical protein